MAEVPVLKPEKAEAAKVARLPAFEAPLFPGRLFTMNPFALMRQFTEDMDRYFGTAPRTAAAAWTPGIEVKQKEGKLLVTAELPGVKKEDVKVHIDNGVLTLEGERKEEKEEKREGFYHSERTYGTFLRSIALPENAKTDAVTAAFNNGLLEIAVPVPEIKAARKEIPVAAAPVKGA